MINRNLLTNSLASTIASEYLTTRFKKASVDYVISSIASDIASEVNKKEVLDFALVSIQEIKRNVFFDALFKSLQKYEKEIRSMLAGIWEEERKIIIANIRKFKKSWLKDKDAASQMLYPQKEMEQKLSKQAAEIFVAVLGERGKQELRKLGVMDVSFDTASPEVQKWIKNYTPKFSSNLETVSVDKLRRELLAGIDAGEGIPELMKRVNTTYEHWNKVRSETIARSETIRASNRGALEAYRQSGVVKKKIWIAEPGACLFCQPLDGKVVGLEVNYFDMGDSYSVGRGKKKQTMKLGYENVESPPLHPRCRCSIGAYIED